MTYPFVQAKWFSPGAINEVRALVIHFAEGGNTVHYFQTLDKDVSSHFVLQYDGSIVQMVRDGDADHCQHIDVGSWSYAGGLNRSVGLAVLGPDVMNSGDHTRVNRYVHAIEIEGFRDKGPNPAQADALEAWVAERRASFPSIRGVIGHGDVQDKACPGALIPWARLGGHGLAEADGGEHMIQSVQVDSPNIATIVRDTPINQTPTGPKVVTATAGTTYPYLGLPINATGGRVNGQAAVVIASSIPYADGVARPTVFYVAAADITITKAPPVPTDCTAEVSAAVAAQKEKDRDAVIAAIEKVLP